MITILVMFMSILLASVSIGLGYFLAKYLREESEKVQKDEENRQLAIRIQALEEKVSKKRPRSSSPRKRKPKASRPAPKKEPAPRKSSKGKDRSAEGATTQTERPAVNPAGAGTP